MPETHDEKITVKDLNKIDEDMKQGFNAINNTLQQILALFQKYDTQYNEDMMKDHGVEG